MDKTPIDRALHDLNGVLFHASRDGDCAKVEQALADGAQIDSTGPLKRTPLHAALESKRFDAAKILIFAGADLEIHEGLNSFTPLAMEHTHGSPETVALLLSLGANPDALDSQGTSPLMRAARHGNDDSALMLAKATQDLEWQTALGSAMHYVCGRGRGRASANLAKELLKLGSLPDPANRFGETPLSNASQECDAETVALLLGAGANPNAREATNGLSCLMLATQRGDERTMELLLAAGADLHALNDKGQDAEAYAIEIDAEEGARWLGERKRLLRERRDIAQAIDSAPSEPGSPAPRI